ncbi:hypothetical protein NP233_g4261 [Leucocoprinus birnbaumii]|uniref:Uncharacterized protein n=1 Tax=Leucocoprinus birnbaumii TaxID=56174 RepID=A0AAD5YT00_9AGAR|nr:hypothetical protein NP233_g4261 [Leucocoprinus birnbaumii]
MSEFRGRDSWLARMFALSDSRPHIWKRSLFKDGAEACQQLAGYKTLSCSSLGKRIPIMSISDTLPSPFAMISLIIILATAYTFALIKMRTSQLSQIPTLGPRGPVASRLNALTSFFRSHEIVEEGYTKVRLLSHRIFKIPRYLSWVVIVNGEQHIEDIRKANDEQLSFLDALDQAAQLDYTIGPGLKDDFFHINVVRGPMTRNIAARFPELLDEIDKALGNLINDSGNGSDQRYTDLMQSYAAYVTKAGLLIKLLPNWAKPIVSRALFNTKKRIRIVENYLQPILQKRLEKSPSGRIDDHRYNDMVTWLWNAAPEEQRTLHHLAIRMIFLNIVAIHTTSALLTHVLFNLASYVSYIEPLREEIFELVQAEGWSKITLEKMRKLDSFIKESQRVYGTDATSMPRLATSDFTFSDGTAVPKGTHISVTARAINLDQRYYSEPGDFQGFRFADQDPLKAQMTALNPEFITFGLGRHACPGRFFAVAEIKAIVARILLNYDIKLTDEAAGRPKDTWFAVSSMVFCLVLFIVSSHALLISASEPSLVTRIRSTEVASIAPISVLESWAQYSPQYPVGRYSGPPKGCEITQVNLLKRHGARFPTSGASSNILAALNKLQSASSYTHPDLQFLKNFTYDLGTDVLVPFGALQSYTAGQSAYIRYLDLFNDKNIPFVRASGSERVIDSATNWTAGFSFASQHKFNPVLSVIMSEEPTANNTLDDSGCPLAGDSDDEVVPWVEQYASPIAERLNSQALDMTTNLTATDIDSLITICPFESITKQTLSPFCKIFKKKDFVEFEWGMDLDKYYGTGYGQAIGGRVQGVGYVNELIARLTNTPVRDDTQTNRTLTSNPATFPLDRTFYADFSHDNQIVAIYSAMGLLNEEHEVLDNTKVNPKTEWDTSKVVPFSSEMVVERLACADRSLGKEFVRIFINDALQRSSFCGGDADGIWRLREDKSKSSKPQKEIKPPHPSTTMNRKRRTYLIGYLMCTSIKRRTNNTLFEVSIPEKVKERHKPECDSVPSILPLYRFPKPCWD